MADCWYWYCRLISFIDYKFFLFTNMIIYHGYDPDLDPELCKVRSWIRIILDPQHWIYDLYTHLFCATIFFYYGGVGRCWDGIPGCGAWTGRLSSDHLSTSSTFSGLPRQVNQNKEKRSEVESLVQYARIFNLFIAKCSNLLILT